MRYFDSDLLALSKRDTLILSLVLKYRVWFEYLSFGEPLKCFIIVQQIFINEKFAFMYAIWTTSKTWTRILKNLDLF